MIPYSEENVLRLVIGGNVRTDPRTDLIHTSQGTFTRQAARAVFETARRKVQLPIEDPDCPGLLCEGPGLPVDMVPLPKLSDFKFAEEIKKFRDLCISMSNMDHIKPTE